MLLVQKCYFYGVFCCAILQTLAASVEVNKNLRIDCHPDPGANSNDCLARGCVWDSAVYEGDLFVPQCYFPPLTGYTEYSEDGDTVILEKLANGTKNPFDTDISRIEITQWYIGETLNIWIGTKDRFKPELKLPKTESSATDGLWCSTYSLDFEEEGASLFYFVVGRSSDATEIWNTSIGGLLFGDRFIQIATLLPTKNIYGFGENVHHTLRHNMTKYTTWPMFSRNESPNPTEKDRHQNLYGVHPFYLAVEDDGRAHGVFILNSNPQEVVTGPGPHLVYRTLGGALDIYFFPGPKPEEVIQQYLALIGTPFLPAYWSLGFQISRRGYKDVQEMREVVNRTLFNNVPLEAIYADSDGADGYQDFTVSPAFEGIKEFVDELHRQDMKTVLVLDPTLRVDTESFKSAHDMGVLFVEWPSQELVQKDVNSKYSLTNGTTIMLGITQPEKHVAFLDFSDPVNNTLAWWIDKAALFHSNISFDGILIDMNEPSNFGTNEDYIGLFNTSDYRNITTLKCPISGPDATLEKPPYETWSVYQYGKNDSLATNTLCMVARTTDNTTNFYNTKNLYGLFQSIATQQAVFAATGKRGAVISRSTFPSSGRYCGHSLGENRARWEDLRAAIIAVQEFNLFGIPYVGSAICGFEEDTNEELCLRWHQLGAFHSLSRNYNAMNRTAQDPGSIPSVIEATRKALNFRYRYLPYLFTLHFEAARRGGTVVRPVFFEFPEDVRARELDYQFMWGPAMMILPVFEQGVEEVSAYLPINATWYSIHDEENIREEPVGERTFAASNKAMIPVLVRGCSIIPRQKEAMTTTAARKNPFELLIAIEYDSFRYPQSAKGQLYWDDGDGIVTDFETHDYGHWSFVLKMSDSKAILTITQDHKIENITIPKLERVDIVGYRYNAVDGSFKLNGQLAEVVVERRSDIHMIIGNLSVNLAETSESVIMWNHYSETTTVSADRRINCAPDRNIDRPSCMERECEFDETEYSDPNIPRCYFTRGTGYTAKNLRGNTIKLTESDVGIPNPFQANYATLIFTVTTMYSTANIRIEPNETRYEPSLNLPNRGTNNGEEIKVETAVNNDVFSFAVKRVATGEAIFDTSIGGMLFSDNFIQIATFLPSDRIYGFGEHAHKSIKHVLKTYTTWGMLARDEAPNNNVNRSTKNSYGVHPFYMGISNDSTAYGVFFLNSNPQEVTTGPAPHLIYRTIGGILDIYFFAGPKPEDVIQQYLSLIGTPFLPAYWALGFQVGRTGIANTTELRNSINAFTTNHIAVDAIYIGTECLEGNMAFTVANKCSDLGYFVDELKNRSIHTTFLFDAPISVKSDAFARAKKNGGLFIRWPRNDLVPAENDLYSETIGTQIMLGVNRPEHHVAFPDFSANISWWIDEIKELRAQVAFDGIWVDQNEPSSYGTNEYHPWSVGEAGHEDLASLKCTFNGTDSKLDKPAYETANVYLYSDGQAPALSSRTLCMLAQTASSNFYDSKNLYGHYQTAAADQAQHSVIAKRGLVVSRSTFSSSGRYGGHWLGGSGQATFDDLRASIIAIQEFNLFGIPYVGADVCSLASNQSLEGDSLELCIRWHQVGAFYPLARSYSNIKSDPQSASAWATFAKNISYAYSFRYQLLPYFYSVFFDASIRGGTVVRPVFFEFPDDEATHDLSLQFMWGSGILVAPVAYRGWRSVRGYLPPASLWYSLRYRDYGTMYPGGFNNFTCELQDDISPVFLRGGSIVVRQDAAATTAESRITSFQIIVAMPKEFRSGERAVGTLFWDDGDSLNALYGEYYHWEIIFVYSVYADHTCNLVLSPKQTIYTADIPSVASVDILGYDFDSYLNATRYSIAESEEKPLMLKMNESFLDVSNNILRLVFATPLNMQSNETFAIFWGASERNISKTPLPTLYPPTSTPSTTTVSVSTTTTTVPAPTITVPAPTTTALASTSVTTSDTKTATTQKVTPSETTQSGTQQTTTTTDTQSPPPQGDSAVRLNQKLSKAKYFYFFPIILVRYIAALI